MALKFCAAIFFGLLDPFWVNIRTMPLYNLSPTQIAETLTVPHIPYFDPAEFADLSRDQLLAFTQDQLAAMTAVQLAAFELALNPAPVVEPTVESVPTTETPVEPAVEPSP